MVVVTAVVVTVKVAEVAPAGIVTETGTVAPLMLEVKVTVMPPAGAGAFRVAVPVEEVPPTTLAGESVMLESASGVSTRVLVTELPLNVAVMLTSVVTLTALVTIEKFTCVLFAGTVIDAGTTAAELLDTRVTTEPPAGAATGIITAFEVVVEPPPVVLGFKLSVINVGVLTVSTALADVLPVALMVDVVS